MNAPNYDAADVRYLKGKRFCWLCGRTEGMPPENWYSPFRLEVAHIASGQGDALRVDDRRAVTLLCSRCHLCHQNHAGGTMNIGGIDYPTIDARHTLWLKMKMDRKFYDRKFLAEYWIGTVPIPEPPPSFFLEEMARHQGLVL